MNNQTSPQFSPQQQADLQAMGLNPQNLDWGALFGKLKLLIDLLERFGGGFFQGQKP